MTPEKRVTAVRLDEIVPTDVAPGITRLGLPGEQVTARAFDFAPGAVWPEVDEHPHDELIYVADGVLLDNGVTYPAGSFLHYWPNSRHRPGTETGARILVFTRG
ncbi:putative anti-ECFsigma factor, ChrR [Actinorhabdospora filicis]|uniref:Anti-ECFsigma factor, ChrR n=1 Tax=Actinorhabdospora filicis TaxID=1785913 RepID=A0A9W6W2H3_9ACTN|nr:cupin domain-containing protein [Actinorhabdospora filicis]GLZ77017.1 putative anti-ECFsigma factor, ChrR [Actinorhabdospora filicis]